MVHAARILLLSLTLGALGMSYSWSARIVPLDRVVAVVNEEAITALELEGEIARNAQILRRQNTRVPNTEVFEKQVLERLIIQRVLLANAKSTGIRISDAELRAAMDRIAQDNKMTLDELRVEVERDGRTFTRFSEDVRGEMMIARLRDREVDGRLVVTEAEVQSFLARQEQLGADKDEEYNIAHILVSVPEQAPTPEVERRKARAEEALAQLRKGGDFAQVAASYSDAGDALQGGAMGWRATARLPTLFVETLRSLAVGAVGGPVRSPAGFHLIKLVDKRGAQTPTVVRQSKVRHILVRLSEIVSEPDALNRLNDLKDRIDNGAEFAALARLHSDDASAARGGELGWVSPGDTVPEFERAMNGAQIGKVTEPFRTPFGWHIVLVEERRDQDMSEDRSRMQARQAIRQRKSEQQWQDWVRYQRDRAYVEYLAQD